MCIRTIAKAKTFGVKDEWQVNQGFLLDLKHYLLREAHHAGEIYEEQLDETLTALHQLGFLKLAIAGCGEFITKDCGHCQHLKIKTCQYTKEVVHLNQTACNQFSYCYE